MRQAVVQHLLNSIFDFVPTLGNNGRNSLASLTRSKLGVTLIDPSAAISESPVKNKSPRSAVELLGSLVIKLALHNVKIIAVAVKFIRVVLIYSYSDSKACMIAYRYFDGVLAFI